MKQSDRGMVRYSPYRSLVEQSTYLSRMMQQRAKVEKKELSADQEVQINELLVHYSGERVSITYWERGCMKSEEGHIDKIDPYARVLYINGVRIRLMDLQSVKRK